MIGCWKIPSGTYFASYSVENIRQMKVHTRWGSRTRLYKLIVGAPPVENSGEFKGGSLGHLLIQHASQCLDISQD